MKALNSVSKEEKLELFYFICSQWDSDPANLIIKNNHIYSFDDAVIADKQYVRYGELPFVKSIDSKALDMMILINHFHSIERRS